MDPSLKIQSQIRILLKLFTLWPLLFQGARSNCVAACLLPVPSQRCNRDAVISFQSSSVIKSSSSTSLVAFSGFQIHRGYDKNITLLNENMPRISTAYQSYGILCSGFAHNQTHTRQLPLFSESNTILPEQVLVCNHHLLLELRIKTGPLLKGKTIHQC